MPFIGNQPAEAFSSFQKQDFTTSATTSYTLDHPVSNGNEIALFINFVRQEPTAAYTASGTSLTLTSATSASDDMYCVFLGKAVQTVNPASGSVGSSQVASTIITGQTAETSIATDDTVLIHDTSAGALRKMTRANFVSGIGGTNTPAFQATLSSNQDISSGTFTKVEFDTENFDTDNTYDNSTNYRFTPAVAGKYVLTANVRVQNCGNETLYLVFIYKNGSALKGSIILPGRNDDLNGIVTAIDVANTTDYYEIYARQGSGGTRPLLPTNTYFNGYKLIE